MKSTQCSDKSTWDQWYTGVQDASFLQSWAWGEFRAETGARPARLRLSGEDQAQGFVHDLGFGIRYLYIPRWQPSTESLESLIEYAGAQGFAFVRIEPLQAFDTRERRTQTTYPRQPQDEWVIDVRVDEDELLAQMHSKTRYNIRLAQRKGVTVIEKKNADTFWQLNAQTRKRDEFKSHGKEYYDTLIAQPFMSQYTAMYNDSAIASILCATFGNSMTYVHGASSNEHRNVMAPYLLQWYAMQSARTQQLHWYNMGGVAPATEKGTQTSFHGYTWDPTHRFTGITRFKVGFGGEVRHFPDAIDIVLRPLKYKLFQLARKLKGYD